MISISFREKRSIPDCSRFLNCFYSKQSEKYSAMWDRRLNPVDVVDVAM